jgi:predicted nuclease of predicted toxin-antitoxin system
VRLLLDSNIVAQAVRALRAAGYDVIYAGERDVDPGDRALLAEAALDGRVFITKDRDLGTLVYRDRQPHRGILLVDDLGDSVAESRLIETALKEHSGRLTAGAFLRVTELGVREARSA